MARGRSIGSIYAELSVKDKMTYQLKRASASLAQFGKNSAKIGFGALAAGTAAASAALVAGTKHTLSMTDELVDLSNQTGVAVADMMVLQQAYKDGGREAAMAGKDIGKMQRALVEATTGGQDPFSSLGLSAKELIQLNPSDQFSKIGAAIMAIQNPAERTAKAMEIFGKGGMGLTTVFEGIPSAVTALGKMPQLAQQFGAAMGEANDLIGHLPLKSDQFFMGFTAGVIGELLPNLRKIDEFDFTTIGQNLGAAIGTGTQSLLDGTAWELFSLNAEKAINSIQASWANNGLAASINSILDFGATGEWNFEKYSTAGIEANEEIATDLQDRIDKLKETISEKYKSNIDAAASLSKNPTFGDSTLSEVFKPEKIKRLKEASPIDMVNEYQKRGLSLSGNVVTPELAETKKISSFLMEIRDRMRKMTDTPLKATW